MGQELTIRVNNPFPTANGVFVVNEGGGKLTNSTYSFLVVAWYNGSDETDNDYGGWKKTQTTEWENFTTDGGNDSITMQWTAPVDATGETRYPSHYTIYYQEAAAWNFANSCTKIASVDGNTTAYEWTTGAGASGIVFEDEATNFTLNPILDIGINQRMQTVRAFDGRLAKKSYAHVNPVDYLEIRIVGMSMTNANYKKLMLYNLYSIPCRLTESATGVPETEAFVQHWFGRWIDMPDYIGSLSKNSKDSYLLRFRVETATLV